MIPPINIDLQSLNFITIVPMLIAVVGALTILCIDLFAKQLDKSLYIMLAILFLVVDFVVLYGFNGTPEVFLTFID